ncbi:hypothetical protein [Rubrivivax rivuli]|uniref:Uncharacterized protein n=1 Tax=Rubrivivax rivuli TaxID=1862385 RepID=A0A437R9F5_9BURK|nr:hypothetical protein [Rubrivivax rivuli]RVU43418.1 hypothetical protein EOE66_21005 [Rubrivivax rivuli]
MPTRFRKTAKGLAEIETRAHRLSPRLRALLIMVDGKRDLAALEALMPQQAEAALAELTSQGFIEASGESAAAAPTPATVPAQPAPPPPSPAADFEKLRREAVRALNDLAGPAAETVALRMEKARNTDELRPLIAQAAQTVANMRGRAAAEAYAARFAQV